jgi:hypothetical protein
MLKQRALPRSNDDIIPRYFKPREIVRRLFQVHDVIRHQDLCFADTVLVFEVASLIQHSDEQLEGREQLESCQLLWLSWRRRFGLELYD